MKGKKKLPELPLALQSRDAGVGSARAQPPAPESRSRPWGVTLPGPTRDRGEDGTGPDGTRDPICDGGRGSCSGARIHRGSGQAVPPAGYCQPLPCPWAARPSTPPRPLRAAAEPAALLALQSRSAAFRKALKLSSKFCSREAVVNRPWPRALPANTPRGRREEGVTEETDEQHQLLPLSLFLKEQRALFLKGRRELIHRHTHTHTHLA